MLFAQDLGGQTSIRPYWRCYYANTAAVIFVIDSTDIERLGMASEELAAMLNEEELRDAALLVFANKQDQPGAKGAGEISEALQLGELKDRNWSIVACSAVDGRGINEGMDWLVVSVLQGRFLSTGADLYSKRCNRIHSVHICIPFFDRQRPMRWYAQKHITLCKRRPYCMIKRQWPVTICYLPGGSPQLMSPCANLQLESDHCRATCVLRVSRPTVSQSVDIYDALSVLLSFQPALAGITTRPFISHIRPCPSLDDCHCR